MRGIGGGSCLSAVTCAPGSPWLQAIAPFAACMGSQRASRGDFRLLGSAQGYGVGVATGGSAVALEDVPPVGAGSRIQICSAVQPLVNAFV